MTTPWGVSRTSGAPHVQQFITAASRQVGTDLICEVSSSVYEYGITEVNINGPQCRLFELIINAAPAVDTTTRTDSNTATYPTPKRVPPNARVMGIWRNATGAASMTLTTVAY